ncbi:MAG: 1-deoxy-D-xylulose-5-phosphate reductoisomerase [Lachnospiraceae bacterium]|nr:1-deoxy-D-xylulose-5-phosphate reductoisomerase [Lachnospiraceae bacterium]
MKRISVLGSTGSIGTQTLDVARIHNDIQVVALAVYKSIHLLETQTREFMPRLVCVYDREAAADFRVRVRDLPVTVVSGMEGLLACALCEEADMVVSAVVGMIGIRPVIEAICAGKDIAFANKETLVTAGHLIMPLVKKHKVKFLPVDSEHSAIFQSLSGGGEPEKLILTASGGPFRGKKQSELDGVSVEDALRHPNWSMGKKITIDSATMVNKGLEVMEASWLFGMEADKIEVVIHPQSIIHSAVEYTDGAVIAQLGVPDMKLPIQYALFYPKRRAMSGKRLSLTELGSLTFERPDLCELPGLSLAYESIRAGGSMPVVYNAANEYAVEEFLNGKIRFTEITKRIADAMQAHRVIREPSLSEILETEALVREYLAGKKTSSN